jgi:hypothetical protein
MRKIGKKSDMHQIFFDFFAANLPFAAYCLRKLVVLWYLFRDLGSENQ